MFMYCSQIGLSHQPDQQGQTNRDPIQSEKILYRTPMPDPWRIAHSNIPDMDERSLHTTRPVDSGSAVSRSAVPGLSGSGLFSSGLAGPGLAVAAPDLFRKTGASFSADGLYRYALHREWNPGLPVMMALLLNPSIANAVENDPTVARLERRATLLGFGRLEIRNLFALVATDPAAMKKAADPVGPDNDRHILDCAAGADLILCGWGAHGTHRGRGPEVTAMLQDAGHALHCLRVTTKSGQPEHPLYISYDTPPMLLTA